MRRILFSWRGQNIYSYPTMLYAGLLVGVFAGAHVAQASGMSADRFAIAVIILLIPALAGSRLYFILTRWDIYRHDPARIWRHSEGGMAMYGGFILAVPLSIPLLRSLGLPFGSFLARGGADDPAWDGLYPDRLFSQRVLFGPAERRLVRDFATGSPRKLAAAPPHAAHGDGICHDVVRRRPYPARLCAVPWSDILFRSRRLRTGALVSGKFARR
jgi:hypothetical protein